VRCFSLHCAERVVTFVTFRLARDIIQNCTPRVRTLWSRSPPIFTFGSRHAYRHKRMGLAQLAVLCALCLNHFLDFCHSRSLVILRHSRLDFFDSIFFAHRFYACAHTCSLAHGASAAPRSVLFMFYTCEFFVAHSEFSYFLTLKISSTLLSNYFGLRLV